MAHRSGPSSYSPKCGEGVFSEVRIQNPAWPRSYGARTTRFGPPSMGPGATGVCAMDRYAPSWMAGARTRIGLTIPCRGCARRGGPRDVPAPRRPRASEPRAARRRRPNAPAAARRSSLEPPPRPLCGLLRPSRGGPRRGTGTHRRNSRAYGRAALVREPPVPSPGVSENPGAPRARFWGRNVAPPTPFCVRISEPMPRPGSACMGVGFLLVASLQPDAFFGGCPEASAARTGARWGARRGAKEC